MSCADRKLFGSKKGVRIMENSESTAVTITKNNHAKGKRKLSQLLIYPKFQLSLIAVNTGIMFTTLVFLGIQQYRSYLYMKSLGDLVHLPKGHFYYQFVAMEFKNSSISLAVAFVFATIVSTSITAFVSHRVAGPIVRLRGHFKRMAETGVADTRLSFRKGDFFEDLPPAINDGVRKVTQQGQGSQDSKAA